MIRKPKTKTRATKRVAKRVAKRIRNPSFDTASDIISTHIIPKKNGVFKIEMLVGGRELDSIEKKFGNYDNAKLAADIAKKVLVKELKSSKPKRNNPDEYRLREVSKGAIKNSMGLPDDKLDVFELGVLYGTQNSLKNYCGAFDFLKRRKIINAINKEISDALGSIARKVEVRGEGIEGPIPIIKKVSSKS